jgi:hypothetical protein
MRTSDESESPADTMTAADVAARMRCSVQTARRYFRLPAGDPRRLPGRKIGRGWVTTPAAFNAWLAGTPTADG